MGFQRQLEELEARQRAARAMGGPDKLARRAEQGHLDARARLDVLLDAGSFREVGLLATSVVPQDRDRTPADGKVSGFGRIDGRRVAVVSNDLTVKGASSSATNAKKIAYVKDTATRSGMPVVFLGESSGARIPDVMGAQAMSQGGADPQQYCRRRETPWVSAVLGPCFGSSTWYTCLSDFVVMRKGAVLAVSSARVTALAIGETVDPEELGGWRLHAEVTGLADAVVETDEQALALVRRFLSYLPGHAGEAPPVAEAPAEDPAAADRLLELVPVERSKVYDIRKVIGAVVDPDSFLPVKERFGRAAVTGLARLAGRSVGIVATNPMIRGGALDPAACRKVTSFLALCDSFHIPIVMLVDTPGFLVGVEGERKAAPAQIMNMMHALQLCSVPKISVILRKSYGQAFLNLGGGRNSNESAAWTTADVSFMDPQIGVSVVLGIRREDDPEAFEAARGQLTRGTSAYDMAQVFGVQTVLDPRDTRAFLIEALATHAAARGGGLGRRELSAWPTYI
ncbi:methylmalonyl-CoA carboxyltransferase [Aquibium sp. A9E412]|uniref:acyl-CoA carboxylase subunit beta n=1 Tax=Aquibium sp. A9E412 TaxID=2976767 RepID=UPI0025AF5457|nr:carboxyl transferase domain-containing protein [Aquibium sp. A9E412]MDN2566716.1 methylmalonyl-CoA carboxyltransferase [Aquibium sp. A9E412]